MPIFSDFPIVTTLSQSARYSVAVEPYYGQLMQLPAALYQAAFTSPKAVLNVYITTNPLVSAFAFSIFAGLVFFIVSEANKNYSQVDRMWPILPYMYTLHYFVWAKYNDIPTARNLAFTLVIGVWSSRLFYNYYRKGGYSIGSEDYRWIIVKKYIGDTAMFILNITFISFLQSVLLLLLASPGYLLLLSSRSNPQFGWIDAIFSTIILTLISIETVADEQQWAYQSTKQKYLKTAKIPANSKWSAVDLDRGFIVSGLWAWSRHPNFACEQAIWFMVYQWGAISTKAPFNWTASGTISLCLIFFGSTILTESISAEKYPQYKQYQQLVSKFFPFFLGTSVDPKVELKKTNKRKSK